MSHTSVGIQSLCSTVRLFQARLFHLIVISFHIISRKWTWIEKFFCQSMPPKPPTLECLQYSNFSSCLLTPSKTHAMPLNFLIYGIPYCWREGGSWPIFGYRLPAEDLKPWPCLGPKNAKIHTLFRTTPPILFPSLGQRKKCMQPCF